MSRSSIMPTEYATFRDLERGYLIQLRRFTRACHEIRTRVPEVAAGDHPIMLSAPGMRVDSVPRQSTSDSGDPAHAQLELLRSQVVLLQNMSAQLITKFPGESRAAKLRTQVDTLARSLDAKSEELREQLGRVARKSVDRTVVTRSHAVMTMLQDKLKKSVGGITEMYLTGNVTGFPGMRGEPVDADVSYLRLTELRGPDGFVHPSYYVTVAYPTEPGNGRLLPMYVSVSPDYRLPGRLRFSAGAKSPRELQTIVMDALLAEGVIGRGTDRDLPLPASAVRFEHDNVKKTTVKGSQIVVLVKDKKTIDQTREDLRRQLTSLVRMADPRNRDLIRMKSDAARGTITFVFSLPANLRGRLVDPDMMRRISSVLDLDASTLQRVKTAIEDPE